MKIGRFDVQDELGRGGMGVVYRAWDPDLHRPVAIKKLTRVTEEHLERFRIEARAAGRLRHDNIVTIYEIGAEGAEPFIVMEFLDGSNLRDRIESGNTGEVAERLEIVRQVCLGLHYAHSLGVAAHRDVKPANIQVTASGRVKVMDFGIAKLADDIALTRNLTETNKIMGTLHYLSPEQIRGIPLDPRSDVWAAGVVLFELVHGFKPFDHPEDDEVMKRIVLEEPATPPLTGLPGGETLGAVVRRCLEKDRGRRFATALELANALEACAGAAREPAARQPAAGLAAPAAEPAPATARDLFEEGARSYGAGRYREALARFRQVLELEPGNRAARSNLALCEKLRDKERAAELYRVGMLLFNQREYGVAVRAFEDLLALDPANQDARVLINWARREAARREEDQRLDEVVRDAIANLQGTVTAAHDRPAPARHEDPESTLPEADSRLGREAAASRRRRSGSGELAPVGAGDRSTSRVTAWLRKLFR